MDKTTPTVGKLLEGTEQRDAIHFALAPMIAVEKLYPGQSVDLALGSTDKAIPSTAGIGIVDPFLKSPVFPEQRFWMFLYPNTITSLRHEWTHPAFVVVPNPTNQTTPTDASKALSMAWIAEFGEKVCMDYQDLIDIGTKAFGGETPIVGVSWDQGVFNDNKKEFLRHVGIIIGKMPPDTEDVYFACSC